MKKATLIIAGIFVISSIFAQRTNDKKSESGFVQCSEFHETKPLRELFPNSAEEEKTAFVEREIEDRDGNIPQQFPKTVEHDGPVYGNDPTTIQSTMGSIHNRAPIHSWAGQAATGFFPLDPSGAVGPNHYVQMINATTFKVWNKTGTALLTGTLGNLWSPATANDGDPVVLYDKGADRWFMSQFGQTGNSIYIAISKTADPTGAWYTYTFTSPVFPDYLKFSVWQDGYYMCSNAQTRVFAFERAKMLIGDASAKSVYASYTQSPTSGFFCPMPADAGDGTLPPAGTKLPFFAYTDNGWGGSNTDAVKVWNTTVTWGTTPTMTATLNATLATAAFDASYNSSWNDVSQPGTTQMLDGIGGVCMFRAQYKVWSTYNSVVLNWAVKISSTQRSIKWVELRQNSSGTWSLYQEGIYTPDTDTRWMGSIAMDNNGGIALCYMKSNSSTIYPGLYYTGRKACDPLGQMTIAETQVVAGIASQTGGVNRDGDYSETWLDPDGVTFWHTGMYMGTGGAQKTQVYSFTLPQCIVSAPPVAAFSTSQTTICTSQSVSFTDLSSNLPTSWLWTFAGGTPATDTTQLPTVVYNSPGTYQVKLIATNSYGSGVDSVTNYITVNAAPPSPTATSNSPLCNGQTINLSTPTVAGATYTWTGPVNYSSTAQNATRPAAPALSGTYTITLTEGSCSSTGTVSVVVYANPAAPTITNSGNTLTSSATTGNQWYLNGVLISGATGRTYTSTQSGVYTDIVTVNGCSSTASNSITITGIAEYSEDNSLAIYPNPNEGAFTISLHSNVKRTFKVEIVNELGQLIFTQNLNDVYGDYTQPIDISRFGKGVYMFVLIDDKNESVKKVFVY